MVELCKEGCKKQKRKISEVSRLPIGRSEKDISRAGHDLAYLFKGAPRDRMS